MKLGNNKLFSPIERFYLTLSFFFRILNLDTEKRLTIIPSPTMTNNSAIKKKLTASAKEAFLFAFDDMGGKQRLSRWAKANPDEFYRLFARLVPVDKTVSGDVSVTFIEDLKK